jgi:hypothetical protein
MARWVAGSAGRNGAAEEELSIPRAAAVAWGKLSGCWWKAMAPRAAGSAGQSAAAEGRQSISLDKVYGGYGERSPLLGFAIQRDAGDLAWRRICFAYDRRICSGFAYKRWRRRWAAEGRRWRTDESDSVRESMGIGS